MNVLCFGDSNTYGYDPRSYFGSQYPPEHRWVDLLAAKTGWQIENRGANGRGIPRAPISIPRETGLVIFLLGANDLLQGADADTTAQRMETFLKGLSIEKEKLLLIGPPPMRPGQWITDEGVLADSQKLSAAYCQLAERLGIRFVDAVGWDIPMAFDGVHFTGEGHCRFAENLYRELCPEK